MSINIHSEYEEDVSFYETSYSNSKNIKPVNLNKPCREYLKKKFKKYRLRRNGLEDPEVLDVSDLFDKSFTLKEPGQLDNTLEPQEPRSFFMKMLKSKSLTNSKVNKNPTKVQTNAFQLMMESRNKSIGSNSPGKDKQDDADQSNETKEFHQKKIKRKLALEKMAEAKGSLKKKELDEIKGKVIKQKLNERKKKFKKMLKTKKTLADSSKSETEQEKVLQTKNVEENSCDNTSNTNVVNIIKEIKVTDPIKEKQKIRILKEDEEFLKKLSPSIRKKENMLSYFQKVDKNNISGCEPDIVLNNNLSSDDCQIIKVKLKSNKNRKKKISLKKVKKKKELETENCVNDNNSIKNPEEVIINKEEVNTNKDTIVIRKRKRNSECESIDIASPTSRPKRTSKKPIKYIEDNNSESSDDEPIFSLKKENNKNNVQKQKNSKKTKDDKKVSNKKTEQKKSGKLAPIFVPKPMIDSDTLEARQKFLSSGMPDRLVKNKTKQDHLTSLQDYFFSVRHVQQIIENNSVIKNQINYFNLLKEINLTNQKCTVRFPDNLIKLELKIQKDIPLNINSCTESLKNIKQSYPNFPVYRTYRLLKSKKLGDNVHFNDTDLENSKDKIDLNLYENDEDENRTNWTDRYRATSTHQIIGNFDSMKELRKWLVTWTENMSCKNSQNTKSSDESDCFISDDEENTEASAMSNNVLILCGPPGTGKTSCVYAIAEEMSIKVIEVNASSKRTGKILLQDLHEATQSHKVNRGKSNSQNSQTSNNSQKTKKENAKSKSLKKSDSGELLDGESKNIAMSLILIDDADVVFDQDDGFASAITQLISTSKRPMVLVTSTLSCNLVQKYINCSNVIKLNRLLPKMLGTWLDILCLVDTGMCWPGSGASIVNLFAGDIRKSINYMEFYALSELLLKKTVISKQDSEEIQNNDDNSSTSWAGKDSPEIGEMSPPDNCLFTNSEPNLVSLWWDMPKLLNAEKPFKFKTEDKTIAKHNLNEISTMYDSLSLMDCLNSKVGNEQNVLLPNPWYCNEIDSVIDKTNNDMFNSNKGLCEEISNYLAESMLNHNRESSEHNLYCPRLTIQKEREKIISKHNVLAESTIPNSILDRKALTLDYWSTCRTICRIEKEKSSSKRNNRFHHYLKTSKMSSQVEAFSKLCNSFNIETVSNI